MQDSKKNIAIRASELENALDNLVAEAGHLLRKNEYWMLTDAIDVLKGIQKRVQPQVSQFIVVEVRNALNEDLLS
jgi:hypothetical protein